MMSTDEPGERTHPKRVLYERIFVDRAFAEDAVEDRPIAERLEAVEP
jgi:hypothetical protein